MTRAELAGWRTTGKVRTGVRPRWFRRPRVVLEVEEKRPVNFGVLDPQPGGEGKFNTRWREADIEDVLRNVPPPQVTDPVSLVPCPAKGCGDGICGLCGNEGEVTMNTALSWHMHHK